MSNLSDPGLRIAADVIDLIEAANRGDITTLSHTAARAHREHGVEALAALATYTDELTEQLAATRGLTAADLIASMRRTAST